MDAFIKLLSPNYELADYRIKENLVFFKIRSLTDEPECPYCGLKAKRVHSKYQREIQDLPIQGMKV